MSANLIKTISASNNLSLVLLKGGDLGGLNSEIKAKIISFLEKYFDVVEGDIHNGVDISKILIIWRGSLHQLRKMKNNLEFSSAFIAEGEKYILSNDGYGISDWMLKAEKICKTDPGFLRQKFMFYYYSLGYQLLLLHIKEGVNRELIIEDIGFPQKNSIDNYNDISCQEFVRYVIIGDTVAYKALPGTIRHIIAGELKNGCLRKAVFEALNLKKLNLDIWKVQPGDYNNLDDDAETVISTYVNAVHTLDLSEIEGCLISPNDLKNFLNFINKLSCSKI